MNKKNKTLIAIFVVLFLIISLSVSFVLVVKHNLKPTSKFLNNEVCSEGTTGCEVTPFVVEEGAYGKSTLEKLEAEGILNNAGTVYLWNRIIGGYSFYAGYYEIPHEIDGQPIDLDSLLGWIANPANAHQDTIWVKLSEGDFAREIARDLAENISLKENPTDDVDSKAKTLIDYWNDENVVKSYMEDYPFITDDVFNSDVKVLLEGYLFPDTYEFFEYSDCDTITRKLLDRTLDVYEKYEEDFKSSDLSIHEVFTLASICQWESGSQGDTEKIAGVFLNRIEAPEVLGSTVTACYAFDLSKEECAEKGDNLEYTQTYNVYNTYTVQGFPPGPVCCPNELCIYAALNPDQKGNYFYFVADMCNDGTAFARTWSEHEYNIDHYYLACAD